LTPGAAWTELGPSSGGQQSGFLPNLAVTALAIFNSGGQKLLRLRRTAVVFGSTTCWPCRIFRLWFQIRRNYLSWDNRQFNGTVTSINGYDNSVELSCTAGTSAPPVPCVPSPGILTPTFCRCGVFRECGQQHNWRLQLQCARFGHGSEKYNAPCSADLECGGFSMTAPSPAA